MKKCFLLCFCLLLLCGCNTRKNKEIASFIEYHKNSAVAIHYPITNIKELDQQIKKDVDTTYQTYQKEYGSIYSLSASSELNIDYTYQEIRNRYLTISITTFINSASLAHPIHEMKTYNYDLKKKKIVSIYDLIPQTLIEKVTKEVSEKLIQLYADCVDLNKVKQSNLITKDQLFTLTAKKITFYFNPYEVASGNCGIIHIDLPLKDIGMEMEEDGEKIKETIEVIKNENYIIQANQKAIALTFDDGPSKYTKEILNLLKQYNGNATFFVLGNKLKIYEDTIRMMYQNGNQIGNHSYSHKWLTKLDEASLQSEINQTQQLVYDITKEYPSVIRPTYGSINQALRQKLNLKVVMWTVDTRDWELKDSKRIAEKALASIKDGSIILMHDTRKRTVDALKIMLPELKKQGYQIVTINELNEIKLIREKQNE